MTDRTVGVIGLGNMGLPMAKNLVDAGWPVVAYNRSDGPVVELEEYGATRAHSPREVAEAADVIITALPDLAVIQTILSGEDGVIAGLDGGETLIDTSTISPAGASELEALLADADATALDAPVSGGDQGAQDGTLSFMVGGLEEVFERHRDVFETLGSTITYCGPVGSGQVAKACNQIVLGTTLLGVCEALVFAQRADANIEAVLEAISGGAAACWTLDSRAPKMVTGDFEPGGYVRYLYDDLEIAQDAADDVGSPMLVTAVVEELLKVAVESGYAEEDISAAIKVVESLAGEQARLES